MFGTIAKPLIVSILLSLAAAAWAESRYSTLIAPAEARRYGLDRVWFTQVELDRARGRITGIQHFVSSSDSYTVFEVRYQGRRRAFSERDVDDHGHVIGKERAQELAEQSFEAVKMQAIFEKLNLGIAAETMARRMFNTYKDRKATINSAEGLWQSDDEKKAALARAEQQFWTDMQTVLTKEQNAQFQQLLTEKPEVELKAVVVPEITLYVTTDRGMIHAIDAETGSTRWATVVGNRDYPTERAGVSEKYVAVVNGPNLYLLNRSTGETAWKRTAKGVPSAGPAVTETFVAVPTFSGNMVLYEIDEPRILPYLYKSNGRVLVQPIATPLSIVWPTDRGFMYVAKANRRGLRYRAEARDTIVAPPSYGASGLLFMTSIDGDVYCVHESSGNELWRFSTGEPLSHTAMPIGDLLYVVTDKNTLYCIDQKTGSERWWTDRVRQFVAASENRVYCVSTADRLVILDAANQGRRIASMGADFLDIFYPNLQTDRIIVGSTSGVVQCLHETQLDLPLVHVNLAESEEKEKRPEIKQEGLPPAAAKPTPQPPPAGQANPFGGGANPFGGGGAQGGGANPFGGGGAQGGGANPFGGGGAQGGGANPFGGGGAQGGGANPFGGGGAQGGGANPFGG